MLKSVLTSRAKPTTRRSVLMDLAWPRRASSEVFDQLPTELHLDFADGRLIDGVHGVPEALGTKLLSGERKPALQRSLSIPLGHAGLAVGAGQAVQRSQHEIFDRRWPLADVWERAGR